MPYDVSIDPVKRRILVRAFGQSTFEEARTEAERLIADPAFDPTYSILVDGRELEYLASYEDALQFRDMFGRLKSSFRGPIGVVVQGMARYGVSRMIATLCDLAGVRMEAFLSLSDAEAWIAEHSGGA